MQQRKSLHFCVCNSYFSETLFTFSRNFLKTRSTICTKPARISKPTVETNNLLILKFAVTRLSARSEKKIINDYHLCYAYHFFLFFNHCRRRHHPCSTLRVLKSDVAIITHPSPLTGHGQTMHRTALVPG